MENQIIDSKPTRSNGVTFWGWLFIISSVLGLPGIRSPWMTSQRLALYLFFCFGYILCGIYVLKLNDIARKAAIVLGILSMVSAHFFIIEPFNEIKKDSAMERWRQEVIRTVEPERQQEAIEQIERIQAMVIKNFPIISRFFFIFFVLPLFVFYFIQIWFFSHPKVKQQFQA